MSSIKKRTAGILASVLSVALAAVGLMAAPAQAGAGQGSATGTIYFAEISTNTVWVGDISNPNGPKSTFWTADAASPDQVATTLTSVAWSSLYSEPGTPLYQKIMIAPLARTAANVVEVSTSGVVRSLAADIAHDRILAVVDNTIISVKPDGTDLRTIVTDDNLNRGETANEWALTIDEASHNIYAVGGDENGPVITEYTMDAAHLVEQSRRIVYSGIETIDGLFVDPVSKILYWTTYQGDAVGKGTVDGLNQETILATAGIAPTGAVISNATGKFYFTTENYVYEMNLDGTGLRELYAGDYTSSGFEGLAIAFGVTLDPATAYDVTYNANVPSGKTATGSVPTGGEFVEGETVNVQTNVNALAVPGYAFTGWNTKADGSGDEYKHWSDQLESYINSFTISADVTLYAQWAKVSVTKSGQTFNVKVAGTQPSSSKYLYITDGTDSAEKWMDYDSNESTASFTIGETIDGDGPITFTCGVEYTFSYIDWANYDDSLDQADTTTSFKFTIPCAGDVEPVTFGKTVFFASGSAKLSPAAVKVLKALAVRIKGLDSVTSIKVVGFVQPVGAKSNDKSLAKARAVAVQKALKKYGVSAKITVVSKGRLALNSAKSRKAVITVTGEVAPR